MAYPPLPPWNVGLRSAVVIFSIRLSRLSFALDHLGQLRHVSIGLLCQDAALPKAR